MFFKNFKKQKILVYGSKGWIGGLFTEFLAKQNISYIEGTARADNTEQLLSEFKKVKPTHIISFIGRTHGTIGDEKVNTIDYLEYPGKLVENIRDNLFSPMILSDLCVRKGIHYTYVGTGCIFSSKDLDTPDPQKYSESSLPNYFGSSYSVVKGFTDRLMHNYPVLNLRIRMPISSVSNGRNFINKIIKYHRICSIPNSMTVLDDFFPVFLELMKKRKTGTYNCTNPGIITHNEILAEYRDTVDPDFVWQNFTQEEQALILKSERSNNMLDTSKLEKEFPKVPEIKKSVKSLMPLFKVSHSGTSA